MEGLLITMDKEQARQELLLLDQPSLPEAMRQLNLCDAFLGMIGGHNVAVCLLSKRKKCHEVVNLSADPAVSDEVLTEVLFYVNSSAAKSARSDNDFIPFSPNFIIVGRLIKSKVNRSSDIPSLCPPSI